MAGELSPITVPVVLRDWGGAELEVQAPLNTPNIFVRIGPVGGFLFDRTPEVTNTLRTVYKQRYASGHVIYGPEKLNIIDVSPVEESDGPVQATPEASGQ